MKILKHKLSVGQAKVSAESYEPKGMTAVFVFAHGAGAGMQHPFMTGLSKLLAERRIGTLRFNFPYMEAKKGRPDVPAVAHAAVQAAVDLAKQLFPKCDILAGGKSFGGRMTSQWAAKNAVMPVKGLIFVGFPLHQPGNPSVERAEHLADVEVPMLFLQGTRDALADWKLINSVCAKLPRASLAKFDKADHSFRIQGGGDALVPLADAIQTWLDGLH